jgi:hypothetical protein
MLVSMICMDDLDLSGQPRSVFWVGLGPSERLWSSWTDLNVENMLLTFHNRRRVLLNSRVTVGNINVRKHTRPDICPLT